MLLGRRHQNGAASPASSSPNRKPATIPCESSKLADGVHESSKLADFHESSKLADFHESSKLAVVSDEGFVGVLHLKFRRKGSDVHGFQALLKNICKSGRIAFI